MFSIVEIVFISFALAVDCFTASFALGVSHKRVRYDILFAIALSFGLFQALMPLFGWGCTMQLGEIAQSVDHWIAFVLLGIRLHERRKKKELEQYVEEENVAENMDKWTAMAEAELFSLHFGIGIRQRIKQGAQ